MSTQAETPAVTWPLPRTSIFDVPELYLEAMRDGKPRRVTIWNGMQPWLFARHEDVSAILKDARFSADVRRPEFPNTSPGQPQVEGGAFHRADGDVHKRGRRAVIADFTMARMDEMRPRIAEIVDLQIDALLEAGPGADFVELFAAAIPAAVICEVLGVPYEEHTIIHACMEHLASLTASQETKAEAFTTLYRMLRNYAEQKRTEPADDLLTRLVQEVEAGERTMREVAELGVLIIGAGHHTTVSMLSLGALSLIREPEERARLLAEGEDGSRRCTEELLRYWSIVHTEPRRVALEDVEIGGHLVKAGESVVCSIPAANRDPRAYSEEPGSLDDFHVARDGKRSLAFGYGPHQCVGQHLTRVEMQEAFPRLFTRIPDLRLAIDEADLDTDEGALVLGLHTMPVTWGAGA